MSTTEQLVHMAEQLHGPEHGAEQTKKIESAILRTCKPTIEQLAIIAAQLLSRHNGDCQAAISEAARLWVACVREHGKLGKRDWRYNPHPGVKITKPARYPLTFDEVLKLLMPKEKDRTKRDKRLRRHYAKLPVMSSSGLLKDAKGKPIVLGEKGADERIAEERNRMFSEREYTALANTYFQWWKTAESAERRAAGAKGNASPKRKKGAAASTDKRKGARPRTSERLTPILRAAGGLDTIPQP